MIQCKRCSKIPLLGEPIPSKFFCRSCHKPGVFGNNEIPKLCKECSEKLNKCQRCMGDL